MKKIFILVEFNQENNTNAFHLIVKLVVVKPMHVTL